MFLMVYSIDWPNFIVWLSLLLEILGNICITFVCFPGCDVINFQSSLIFLSRFYTWPKSRDKNLSRERKELIKVKYIFKGLSVGKNCTRPENAPLARYFGDVWCIKSGIRLFTYLSSIANFFEMNLSGKVLSSRKIPLSHEQYFSNPCFLSISRKILNNLRFLSFKNLLKLTVFKNITNYRNRVSSNMCYFLRKHSLNNINRRSRSDTFLKIGVLKNFCNIHRKTPALESLFN